MIRPFACRPSSPSLQGCSRHAAQQQRVKNSRCSACTAANRRRRAFAAISSTMRERRRTARLLRNYIITKATITPSGQTFNAILNTYAIRTSPLAVRTRVRLGSNSGSTRFEPGFISGQTRVRLGCVSTDHIQGWHSHVTSRVALSTANTLPEAHRSTLPLSLLVTGPKV